MAATGRPFLRRGPSGPLAVISSGLVQVGYDQPEKTQSLPLSDPVSVIPRTAVVPGPAAPLQVLLPGVVPGNFLEIDYQVALQNEGGIPGSIYIFPVVNFAGSLVLAPASGWFVVNNGQASSGLVEASPGRSVPLRGLISVEIPPGATDAVVQLFYSNDIPDFTIGGTVPLIGGSPGSTLKVTELEASVVSQPLPTPNLIPF